MKATTEDILHDPKEEPLEVQEELPFPVQGEVFPPKFDKSSAVEVYNLLRQFNHWLPDPRAVSSGKDMELIWSGDGIATLSLTVFITLPNGVIEKLQEESQ